VPLLRLMLRCATVLGLVLLLFAFAEEVRGEMSGAENERSDTGRAVTEEVVASEPGSCTEGALM
jgi:hypothetical protein